MWVACWFWCLNNNPMADLQVRKPRPCRVRSEVESKGCRGHGVSARALGQAGRRRRAVPLRPACGSQSSCSHLFRISESWAEPGAEIPCCRTTVEQPVCSMSLNTAPFLCSNRSLPSEQLGPSSAPPGAHCRSSIHPSPPSLPWTQIIFLLRFT